ncbi:MAG: alkaline phosphatase family protein, partial [Prevotella nanceiensis]|nr:alkaline phosphatase family protein [Hoylesella nanceiensis]
YLNRKFIEDKRLSLDEVYNKSKDFLKQNAGVVDVHKSAYPTSVSGDIILDITPGWRLLNEDTHHSVVSRLSFVPFPIIFYGLNLKPEQVKERVLVEHIAPTIANAIHIRAPNACALAPLF